MEIFKTNNEGEEKYWISISDMMSGLMIVFLFISVVYMINVWNEKNKIKEIAVTYNRLQNDLYKDLHEEFKNDLKKWNAYIDRQTLSVRFEAPEVLFKAGSYKISKKFKLILNDFFPRFIAIITKPKYINDIEEIRIEGHTSSEWNQKVSYYTAYFLNMELSQNRTRSVLKYVLMLRKIKYRRNWVRLHLTANGLSSSKLIYRNGKEDKKKSRRVEFRVKTNAEKRIVKILEES